MPTTLSLSATHRCRARLHTSRLVAILLAMFHSAGAVFSFSSVSSKTLAYTDMTGFYTSTVGTSIFYNLVISCGNYATNSFITDGTGATTVTISYTGGYGLGCTQARTSTMTLRCGASDALVSVVESPSCVYSFEGTTPACCAPTPSPTASPSSTPPITASVSSYPSAAATPTTSVSGSRPVTVTTSTSSSPSLSRTATVSMSSSISRTHTGSASPSVTMSASPSSSWTTSATILPSSSTTPSSASSPSSTNSQSPSASSSLDSSFTASMSASPTASWSPTVSASNFPTSSPAPIRSFCAVDNITTSQFGCAVCPPLAPPAASSFASQWGPAPSVHCWRDADVLPDFSGCTLPTGWHLPGDTCDFSCGTTASDNETISSRWGPSTMICDANGAWIRSVSTKISNTRGIPIDCEYASQSFAYPWPACGNITTPPPAIIQTRLCNTTLRVQWNQPDFTPPPTPGNISDVIWRTHTELGAAQAAAIAALAASSVVYVVSFESTSGGRLVGSYNMAAPASFSGPHGTGGVTVDVDLLHTYYQLSTAVRGQLVSHTMSAGEVWAELQFAGRPAQVNMSIVSSLDTLSIRIASDPVIVSWADWAASGMNADCDAVTRHIGAMLSTGTAPTTSNPSLSDTTRLIVGDALPPAAVDFTITSESALSTSALAVKCEVFPSSPSLVLNPASIMFSATAGVPQSARMWLSVSPDAVHGSTNVELSQLRCNASSLTALTSDARQLLTMDGVLPSLEVVNTNALWPFFSDIIVELPEGKLKSVWASSDDTLAFNGNTSNPDDMYPYILAARRSPLDGASMSLFLSGQTNITLVADRGEQRPRVRTGFTPGTTVRIGDTLCPISWVSSDGMLLRLTTPAFSRMCENEGADCGVKSITVNNPSVSLTALQLFGTQGSSSTAAQLTSSGIGGSISCPPFCPGVGAGHVPTVSVSTSTDSITGLPTSSLVTRTSSGAMGQATGGMYYISACVGYTDPTLGSCANATSPLASSTCAWGSADACRPCGSISPGVICPGGYRVWPLPTYYVSSEASTEVFQCPAPAYRCMGWRPDIQAVQCAEGYQQGSRLCGLCASGYYAAIGGECRSCPTGNVSWLVVQAALYVIGVLFGLCTVCLALVWIATKQAGGTIAGGARRVGQFFLMAVSCMQAVVQVSRAASPGLPSNLQTIYGFFAAFQLDFEFLPPSCIQGFGGVFRASIVLFMVALILMLFMTFLHAGDLSKRWACAWCDASSRARTKLVYWTKRTVIPLCALLYAMVCNATLSVFSCDTESMTLAWYLKHVTDKSQMANFPPVPESVQNGACDYDVYDCEKLQGILNQVVQVQVLTANPYVICGETQHTEMVAFAVIVFIAFLLCFPLYTWLLVSVKLYQATTASTSASSSSSLRAHSNNKITKLAAHIGAKLADEPAKAAPLPTKLQRSPSVEERGSSPLMKRSHSNIAFVINPIATPHQVPSVRTNSLESDSAPMLRKTKSQMALILQSNPVAVTPTRPTSRKSFVARRPSHVPAVGAPKPPSSSKPASVSRLDEYAALKTDPSIAYFTNADYRASRWYFRHIDFLLLFILSCVAVYMPYATTIPQAVAKSLLQCIVLIGVCVAIFAYHPFPPQDKWMQPVKVYTIVFSTFSSLMSMMVDIVRIQDGVDQIEKSSAVAGFSYLVFALSVGLVAVMLVAFWLGLLADLRKEQAQLDEDAFIALKTSPESLRMTSMRGVLPALTAPTSPPLSKVRRRSSFHPAAATKDSHLAYVNQILASSPSLTPAAGGTSGPRASVMWRHPNPLSESSPRPVVVTTAPMQAVVEPTVEFDALSNADVASAAASASVVKYLATDNHVKLARKSHRVGRTSGVFVNSQALQAGPVASRGNSSKATGSSANMAVYAANLEHITRRHKRASSAHQPR